MSEAAPAIVDPDRLRMARLKRRLRQRDVSADLSVSPQRISDYEQGVRHPSPDQVAALVRILGPEILCASPEVRR